MFCVFKKLTNECINVVLPEYKSCTSYSKNKIVQKLAKNYYCVRWKMCKSWHETYSWIVLDKGVQAVKCISIGSKADMSMWFCDLPFKRPDTSINTVLLWNPPKLASRESVFTCPWRMSSCCKTCTVLHILDNVRP